MIVNRLHKQVNEINIYLDVNRDRDYENLRFLLLKQLY